jgi:Ricin-type beta-trefoil lectin domain
MCLDLAGGKKDNGTPVYCYPCHGAANQRWNLRGITYNQLKSFGVGV